MSASLNTNTGPNGLLPDWQRYAGQTAPLHGRVAESELLSGDGSLRWLGMALVLGTCVLSANGLWWIASRLFN